MELIRQSSPSHRLRLALSLSQTVLSLARGGIARSMPEASEEERRLRFVALHYGEELAEELRRHLAARRA